MTDIGSALVTGAASGIGRAMVRQLVSEGMQVTAVDVDREPLRVLGDELGVATAVVDVTDRRGVADLADRIDTPDLVCLNAGIVSPQDLPRTPAVIVVTTATALVIAGIGWLVTSQVRNLVSSLPQYSEVIRTKAIQIREWSTSGVIEEVKDLSQKVAQDIKSADQSKAQENARTRSSVPWPEPRWAASPIRIENRARLHAHSCSRAFPITVPSPVSSIPNATRCGSASAWRPQERSSGRVATLSGGPRRPYR